MPAYSGKVPFSGLVGEFEISATLDRREITPDETATLAVTVKGRGNLKEMAEFSLDLPDGLKSYVDKPEENINVGVDGYVGSKVFKFALVPVKSGEYEIGPLELCWFDLATESYKTASTKSFKVQAKAGKVAMIQPNASEPLQTAMAKREVALESTDILPISDDLSALDDDRPLGLWFFASLMLVPPVLFFAYLVWERKSSAGLSHAESMRRQAANSLSQARNMNDLDELLLNLNRAVCSAVFSRTKDKSGTITAGEAREILRSCSLGNMGDQFEALMNRIDGCRFGGIALGDEQKKKLLADVQSFVNKVLP